MALGYYRHIPVTKRLTNGKVRRYKNLAAFNSECSTRGIPGVTHNMCELRNIRRLKDGGGLAKVRSTYPGPETRYARNGKPSGTWLLHFADYGIMTRHLQKRMMVPSGHLKGARSRGRRRR